MKGITIRLVLWAFLSPLFWWPGSECQARAPEEAEFHAATLLGYDIARWISKLEEVPASVAIFSIHANEPFDADFTKLIETEIVRELRKRGIAKVTLCGECRTPQVRVQGSDIIVFKGAPDTESIKRAGRHLQVDALLVAEIYRTKLSLLASTVLYSNHDGSIVGAEKFSAPALNFNDASVQFLATYGAGLPIQTSASSGFTMAANILLLEELGFGKGGLGLGTILATGSTLIYLNPTLSLRGRFGSSLLSYAFMMGAGFGFNGSLKGVTARAALEVFFGSWAVGGAEGLYFLGDTSSGTGNPLKAYIGAHVGFALGR